MVSDKAFTTDGSQKIFTSDFEVISEDHLRVFLDSVVQSRDDYDLINNAAVFHVAPTAGQAMILQVGTTPGDILDAPTDAGIVALNIADVNTVANNIDDVTSVADNMAEVLNADTNAAAAAASATAAATSETNAANSATSAATSATNATNEADYAEEWATKPEDVLISTAAGGDGLTDYSALHHAAKTATSETNAATSETNAANSATASASSATAAATSETNAATSATNSAASATASATSATNAATSETNAATSASAASTSATAAGVSETNAAASAAAASTSETNAATSATNAATSETNAAASAAAAQASLDQIEGSYLGVQTSDPTLDLNGDPITAGDWYYNSTTNITRIYDGTVWQNGAVSTADFVSKLGDTMTGELDLPSLQFTGGTLTQGTMSWNTEDETVDLAVSPDVTYQLGQELGYTARNISGATLTNGTVVRVTGASGSKITIDAADATTEVNSSSTFAVVTEDISNNSTGKITTEGLVRGLDTSTFTEGVAIWLSTTSGTFTATKPATPNHLVHVGWVVRSHATEGTILVKINNGWEVDELHDVLIGTLANNDLLFWDATNSYWYNKTLAISDTTGLQTALDGKVDDAQVLTDVPAGAVFTDTVYTHPSGDGNLHVPATGTLNDGKILTAGATAGSLSWQDPPVALPDQTGHADQFLKTNGTVADWADVPPGGTQYFEQATAPTGQADGTLWLDTDDEILYQLQSASWVQISTTAMPVTNNNVTSQGLYENANTISADYTITTGNNATSAGPITVNTGVTVTIPTGSTWHII